MASSGSYAVSTTNGYVIGTVSWEVQSQDYDNNTSTIYVSLRLSRTNSYTTWGSGEFWVGIDSQRNYNSLSFSISQDSDTLMAEGTFTVNHYADGSFWIYVRCGGTSDVFEVNDFSTGDEEVWLDTIPRASSPSVNTGSCDLGTSFTINTNRASSSFTHSIKFVYGNYSTIIATGVTDSFSYTPSKDLASQFPNATSGICRIDITTYNGNSEIGTNSTTLTLTIPSDIVPTITNVTTADAMGYLVTYGAYIQNKSKCTVTTAAAGAKGSTITSYKVTVNGTDYNGTPATTGILTASGTITISVIVTDSRGRKSAAVTRTITVLAYTNPVCSTFTASRCTSAGAADDAGAYTKVTMNAAITSLNAKNGKTYTLQYKKTTDTSFTTAITNTAAYTYNTYVIFAVSTESAYDLRFTVSDSFSSAAYDIRLSTAYAPMDFRTGGKGIAIGKVATQDGLDIAMEVFFNGIPLKTFIGNLMYPIGAIYTSVNATSPSALFGGTWIAWGAGRVPVGIDASQTEFNAAEKAGGEKTHTITVTEMPSHSHFANGAAESAPNSGNNLFMGAGNPPVGGVGYIGSTGGGAAHNNLQPYITCYMWKRTA